MRTFPSVVLAASAAALVLANTRDCYAESVRMEHGLAALLPAEEGATRCYSLSESDGGGLQGLNVLDDLLGAQQNGEGGHRLEDVVLELAYGKHPAGDNGTEGPVTYYFRMTAKPAGEANALLASGECMDREGRAWCGVECDGGGFFVDPEGDKLRFTLDAADPRLRMTLGCSEEDAVELTPELTGEMVMLESADAATCEAAQARP
jgi:hypothetical protein